MNESASVNHFNESTTSKDKLGKGLPLRQHYGYKTTVALI